MKNEKRHEMNEGAQAVIKHLRGRISTMGRKGILDGQAVLAIRGAIKESIAECSQRPGGLGRK